MVGWRNRPKAHWHVAEYFRSAWEVPSWVKLGRDTLFFCYVISNFPSMFVCVRESKLVFIEMEPCSRSKAEQGMLEFGFITGTAGHFLFISTVMLFWASARLQEQSHSWVDLLFHTLHFSHFVGFDWANASRKKKDLLIRDKSLAASRLLLVEFVSCVSHLVEVQVVFALTHLVNSLGFSALVSQSFITSSTSLVTCPEHSCWHWSMWWDHLSCSEEHSSPRFNLHFVFHSKIQKWPSTLISTWFVLLPRFL